MGKPLFLILDESKYESRSILTSYMSPLHTPLIDDIFCITSLHDSQTFLLVKVC